MGVLIVKHGQQVQLSRKTVLIKICLNINLSAVSTEPSVIFFLNTGRFQTNVLQLKKKKKNTCLSFPQGQHMSKLQILQCFQKHPPSPSPLCSAGRARYATSPQSDAEGRLEDNTPGGRVLQAQMAEQNSTTSKRRVFSCPHIISLCFATVICRFFRVY